MVERDDVVLFRRAVLLAMAAVTGLLLVGVGGFGMLFFSIGNIYVAAGMCLVSMLGFLALFHCDRFAMRHLVSGVGLAAAGELEHAAEAITRALSAVSLFPDLIATRALRLANVRFLQRRYPQVFRLARAVRCTRVPVTQELREEAALLEIESLLAMKDFPAMYRVLTATMPRQPDNVRTAWLVLAEARYEAAVGAYARLLDGLAHKLGQCNVLPVPAQARLALLASEAAAAVGKAELAEFLRGYAQAVLADRLDLLDPSPEADTSSTFAIFLARAMAKVAG